MIFLNTLEKINPQGEKVKKILITFDTISNSTQKAASIIYNELLSLENVSVDLKFYKEARDLDDYDIVIIGSPMRFKNFNSSIRSFISRNKEILRTKKVIYFLTCLYMIEAEQGLKCNFPVYIDPLFNAVPKSINKMNIMDKTHSDVEYINTILSHSITPEAVGFFKGKLDLSSLGFFAGTFMRVVIFFTKKTANR